MPAITLDSNSVNLHLHELARLMQQQQPDSFKCLIITDNDAALTRRLTAAFGESVAMLQIAQRDWDFESPLLSGTIAQAVEEGDFDQLVLVANSRGAPVDAQSKVREGEIPGGAASHGMHSRLLLGVRRQQQLLQAAKARFIEQYRQLSEIPAVGRYIASRRLHLHGLFYIGESGLFLHYDRETETLRPLINPLPQC